MVCGFSLSPRRTLPAEVWRLTQPLRTRGELVEPAAEFVQTGLEDCTLRLRVGGDLEQAPPQAGLDLVRPLPERVQCVVSLPLERRPQSGEPLLDPRGGRVAHVVEPLR